jgi:hypothetical protein
MKRKILYACFAIGLISGIVVYKLWNKPHKETADAKADVSMSPSDLLAAYNADEAAANAKYLDKIIEVKGKIKSLNTADAGNSLSLDTGDDMAAIICEFESKEGVEHRKVGDEVTVKGFCTGKLMDVVLVRCSIQ